MDIVVLAGGLSPERNVSLASGGQIANALTAVGHRVLLVDPYAGIETGSFDALYAAHRQDDYARGIPADEPDLAAIRATFGDGDALVGPGVVECCRQADVVFLGLHGSIGENGQLQALLDVYGVRYTGSGYAASLLAMDKVLSKRMISFTTVPTAPYTVLDIAGLGEAEFLAALGTMPMPYVVKPRSGGSSIGVTIVQTPADVPRALGYARTCEDQVIVEPYIAGREFSAGVLGDQALPVIEILAGAQFFDYQAKYQGTSREVCPADIPADLEQTLRAYALEAHHALGLGSYSRSDFIVTPDGRPYWLESNSLPGMSSESLIPKEARAAGMTYPQFCQAIVELACNR